MSSFFQLRASLVSACGRIGSAGGVKVEKPGVRGVARDVAIAVGVIGSGATRRKFLAARRLRELPNGGVGDTACGCRLRIARDDAAGRRRARVIEDPVSEATLAEIVANVVGGDDGHTVAFVDGHARAIDSCAITGARECIDPGAQVCVILCRQTAAFLYI